MTLPGIDTLASFGGTLSNSSPVEDPTTDRDAVAAAKMLADVAAMTHTGLRAWARVGDAVVDGATTHLQLLNHGAMWNGPRPDVPTWRIFPNGLPTVANLATGSYTLTWPATVVAEDGTPATVSIRAAGASIEGGLVVPQWGHIRAQVLSANVVQVKLLNTSAAPSDLGFPIFNVWVL